MRRALNLLSLLALMIVTGGAAPYVFTPGLNACAPAGDADLAVLGSEWQVIHRFVEICRIRAPDGKIPIEVAIVRLDRMFAIDLFRIARNLQVPNPVLLDTGKHVVATLVEGFPIDPPGRLSIAFADWRSGFPWRVDMREDAQAAVVSHHTWPLWWDPAEHRYVDRDKHRH